jgi:hypothetical protein
MRPIPGTITDPASDTRLRNAGVRLYPEPRDRTKEVVPLEPADPEPPNLGEHWLRAKVKAHGPEEFHRADPQLVRAAVSDVLRLIDACRSGVSS